MAAIFKNTTHIVSASLLAVMIIGWVIMLTVGTAVPSAYVQLLFAFAGVFTTITGVKAASNSGSSGTGSNPQLGQ